MNGFTQMKSRIPVSIVELLSEEQAASVNTCRSTVTNDPLNAATVREHLRGILMAAYLKQYLNFIIAGKKRCKFTNAFTQVKGRIRVRFAAGHLLKEEI